MRLVGAIYKDSEVLADSIAVELNEHLRGGLRSWRGYMLMDQGKAMDLMLKQGQQTYQVVLEDGRIGDFFFTSVRAVSDRVTTAAEFVGTGPLARPNEKASNN